MGCASSSLETPEEREKRRAETTLSTQIDKRMQAIQTVNSEVHKLLLLGPGESGKSTLFKHATKLFRNGFTSAERSKYLGPIHVNCLEAMQALSNALRQTEELVSPECEESRKYVDNLCIDIDGQFRVTHHNLPHLKRLWNDPAIQKMYAIRNTFQLSDGSKYILDNLDRIVQPNFTPDDTDILSCRIRSTGIVYTELKVKEATIQIVDVGGQRSERKKWMSCFDGVTGVIFVAAISEFDQVLFEDELVNRIEEALDLFEEVCNSKCFESTSIILFLNKCDLFADKIQIKPLNTVYDDYKGDLTFDAQATYMQTKFVNRYHGQSEEKKIYSHFTCAMDPRVVQKVFDQPVIFV